VWKHERKRPLGRCRRRGENIKTGGKNKIRGVGLILFETETRSWLL
jgi:hypothetical protein